MLLFAWLKDKKFGNNYFEKVQELNVARSQAKDLVWLTWKQLVDKHGEDEAKARVKAGTILARKDPKDNRYWQFLGETDSQKLTIEQIRGLKVQNAGKLKGNAAHALQSSTQAQWNVDDATDIWDADDVDTGNFDLKALQGDPKDATEQDEDENEDEASDDLGLNKFLSNQSSSSKRKVQKGKNGPGQKDDSFNKKLEALTQLGDADSHDKAMRKLSTMHSLLSKQELSLKMAKKNVTGANVKKLDTVHNNIIKYIDCISKMVVTKPKMEIIKKTLLSAAAASKAANVFLSVKK